MPSHKMIFVFKIFHFVLGSLVLFLKCDAGKIGVFMSTISNSQVVFTLRLAEILADSGHDLVIIRSIYSPEISNIRSTNKNIREIRFQALSNQEYFTNVTRAEDEMAFKSLSPFAPEIKRFDDSFNKMFLAGCKKTINDTELLEAIRKESIDIAFTNHYDICMIGVIHHLGIRKWIWMSTTPVSYHASYSGSMSSPSIVPLFWLPLTNQMTYTERAYFFMQVLVKFANGFQLDGISALLQRKFGNDFPSIKSLLPSASLHMVNSDELIEYSMPITHKTVFIGGIDIDSPKLLSGEFEQVVSKINNPIVLVSFGSVKAQMPKHWLDSFIGMFRQNQHLFFIWKYEEPNNTTLDLPDNVFVKNWIPQTDLLGHDKIAAFVTHAEYNSINECIRAGKPMILVPLFADQPTNAKLVEFREMGLSINKENLTANSISEAVNRIVYEKRYQYEAQRFSDMIRDKPIKPAELLVKWTNFLLKHTPDFNVPHMNFVHFYCLDIILPATILSYFVLIKPLKFLLGLYYWSCFDMAYKEKIKMQ